MKKVSNIVLLILCFTLCIPSIAFSATSSQKAQKIRHHANFYFDLDKNKLEVLTTVISFNTGLAKGNEFLFHDKKMLPKASNGEVYNDTSSGRIEGTVVDTPTGLKAYAVVEQLDEKVETYVHSIFEFDYTTATIRKVMESKKSKTIIVSWLFASLGYYEISYGSEIGNRYSLIDNKRLFADGFIINSRDVISTAFSLNPHPKSLNYGVFCSTKKPEDCNFITSGGKLGAKVKVKRNEEAYVYDKKTKIGTTSRSFNAGATKIQTVKTNNKYFHWEITGTRNGNSKVIFNSPMDDIEMSVSPSNKYLILIAEDTAKDMFTIHSSVVHIFDLETLTLVRKYNSHAKALALDVYWKSDELYMIDYHTDYYPSAFYYIPSALHMPAPGYDVLAQETHFDTFSYEGLFHIIQPRAIKWATMHIEFESQPAFTMNGRNFVPLKEFAKAFGIKYAKAKDNITFTRDKLKASLPLKNSGILQTKDNDFVPLGKWNEALGLYLSTNDLLDYGELIFYGSKSAAVAGYQPIPTSEDYYSQLLKRDESGYVEEQRWLAVGKNFEQDTVRGASITLHRNNTMRLNGIDNPFVGKTITIEIYTPDLQTLITKVPVTLGKDYMYDITVPITPLKHARVTVIVPAVDNEYYGYTLQVPPAFNKNVF
ncbi:hypothetical protein I6N90_08450 [Paenibacillus sp. GSMTC-2017]|uniref:hypothetical protein n=1 Tax=Paenibacillus sp. GSMTC-2017 TaxID=2794350 RepID=UPI0018D6D7BF|nr:hypothetical protein [Paenibacillus sp. GSMTC-2017]MBH5317833.1 hypothetical protein [Paenibacillus sp. GSMTC-2017]